MAKTVAAAVLKAVEIHEGSFDKVAANIASIESEYVDYSKFYGKSLEASCYEASPELGRLIYLALDGWWNDTIWWAEQVLDPTATCIPTNEYCQHGVQYDNGEPLADDHIQSAQEFEEMEKARCPLCIAHHEAQRSREKDDE